jgi:hypothetical protein
LALFHESSGGKHTSFHVASQQIISFWLFSSCTALSEAFIRAVC